MPRQLLGTAIAANTITTTQLQTTIVNNITQGGGPRVTSLIYPDNDTAANTAGGQTIYVVGSGFATNAAVYINGNAVPSISFISSSNLQITTPALSSATYPLYVINPENGATAIHIPGLIVSGEPTWVTSAGSLNASQDELSSWSYSLSATGDAPITYALAAGSSLPTGVSLASNGTISGTISSPTGNVTTYTFSVVATDAQNQDSTRQFTVTTSTGEGALFANNVLLIHADGTNNGNNHHFLDSSNNNFTITRSGNATQGSYSPFSQTGWSNYFNGSSALLAAGTTDFQFGTGDFTVEGFIFITNTSSGDTPYINGTYDGSDGGYALYLSSGCTSIAFRNGDAGIVSRSYTFAGNKWYHVAVTRSSSTLRFFVDGAQVGADETNYTQNINRNNSQGGASIGRYAWSGAPGGYFHGYISNLRVVKGTALYTGSYTKPTSSLSSVANTVLATCQSNRFIDTNTQTTAKTITIASSPSVQPFSPFAPSTEYSTANVGGSGYFDGTDDYLRITDNAAFDFGSGDFTIECWAYTETFASQYNVLVCQWGSSTAWIFRIQSTLIGLYANIGGTQNYTASVTNTTGQWDHFAVTRSGTTLTFYKNGVSVGTTSISGTINNAAETISIGVLSEYNSTTTHKGYISGLRVIKGSAIAPTITSPPTNIANTSLLCNFTNAGIFDQTAKNVLETVGDAKVSTSVYKYGTGSIAFDGTNDNIVIQSSPNLDFGTGDFTIELWINFSALSTNRIILDKWVSGNANSWQLYWRATGTSIVFLVGASTVLLQDPSSSRITTNTWYHIAVTRSGTTNRLFIDGVEVASATNSTNLTNTNRLCIGEQLSTLTNDFNGYIDDLRITKGYARYTSNFTPPTSALKDK